MKQICLAVSLLLLVAAGHAQVNATGNITVNGSTCAVTNACVIIQLPNSLSSPNGSLAVGLSGTWSATVQFEKSVDGVVWVAALSTDASPVSSATSNIQPQFSSGGYNYFRVRCSAYSSGTVAVTIQTSPSSARGGGSGGGGANTALSNLASVAINTTLLPGAAAAENLGTALLPFGDVFIGGSASHALDFDVSGLSTNRTVIWSDAAGTVTLNAATQTLTNKSIAGSEVNSGTVAIANGGTGAATQQAGFDALAPTSTVAGSLLYWNGTHYVKVDGNASGTNYLQENSSGVPSWAAGSSSVAWDAITNPSGNMALSNSTHTSIFTGTAATNQFFAWKNSTAAVVGTSQGSPILSTCGRAFHGSADVEDCLTLGELPGNGNDAAITFTIGHTGTSTGTVTTAFPGPVQAGVAGGVGGTLDLPEGTAASAASGHDIIYADSTAHRPKMTNNNGSAVQIVGSGVDVNTSDQVTTTHLSAALPVNQGGTGTTSTLTGLMRGNSSAMTAAELSGDCTTSGSNAITCKPTLPAAGSSGTFSGSSYIFVCSTTCTITVPVPAAGLQYCAMNTDNVATVITLSAIGSSARYENQARTAYGTAGTGTLVSGGAVKDMVCLLGLDSTHYLFASGTGTWTAN